jgi:hypothetical protein
MSSCLLEAAGMSTSDMTSAMMSEDFFNIEFTTFYEVATKGRCV